MKYTALVCQLVVITVFSMGCSEDTSGPPPPPRAHTQILWGKSAGGGNGDHGWGVATDGLENVFVTGQFRDSATFNSTTLTSAGGDDVFVAEYDAAGNVLWARSAGGAALDSGWGIATDVSGNVFVTGQFIDNADFGQTTLRSAGSADIFVVKYDAAGNVLWAKSAGGADTDYGYGVAPDGSGNVFLTGMFKASADFGDTTLTSAGDYDVFVAKHDAAGNVLWAKSAGGADTDYGYGVAPDGSGNVFLTGMFKASADFGDTTLTSAGRYDVFVAKYEAAGNVLWARSAGGAGPKEGWGAATDGSGNVLVTGLFYTSASFGSTTLTSVGDGDVFVAKYDTAGNVLWARSGGSASFDYGSGVATDGSGNVFVTGTAWDGAIFGGTTLTSAGSTDIFVAKYDAAGNVLWARSAGGAASDSGWGAATDGSGNVLVTGDFRDSASFGGTTLTSAGGTDIFVVKIGPNGFE